MKNVPLAPWQVTEVTNVPTTKQSRWIARSDVRCCGARTTRGGAYGSVDLRSCPGAMIESPSLGQTSLARTYKPISQVVEIGGPLIFE